MMTNSEHSAYRLLDANANRAAEGLRTLEDIARLVREDEVAAGQLKGLRHRLSEIVRQINRDARLAARCAASDAGTELHTVSESLRPNLASIIPAAVERTTQALRNLEEFGKLHTASIGQQFKQLRYEAYDVLAQVELRLASPQVNSAQLLLLIDCGRPLKAFAAYVEQLASHGVDWFQLRDKQADGRRLLEYARTTVEVLRSTSSRLIVNDRVDVALASGAAGVHLGQDDLPLRDARRMAGPELWIGISTHDVQQALEAEADGADYIGCGPTFPSQTKAFDHFPGIEFLTEVARRVALPSFAIGGVDAHNLSEVLATGCRRIAVSHAIHHADQPMQAARQLSRALNESSP